MAHPAMAGRVPAGTFIGSAVKATFEVERVAGTLTIASNVPLIKIEPARTPSTLILKRLSDIEDEGVEVVLGDVAYAVSPATNPTIGKTFTAQQIDGFNPFEPINLIKTDSFLPGDLIFFHVIDRGHNHLPDVVETLLITVTGANGDIETLRLSANGPDSSDFYGYALAVGVLDATPGDGRLATGPNITVEARYEDAFDAADSALATALVDARVNLFDALSGDPVDGVILRVYNEAGELQTIFGTDGSSTLGTSVESGVPMTDASGQTYAVEPGELRIPYLPPGTYRVDVDTPSSYVFPSDIADERIATSAGTTFRLLDGSRGENFELPLGGTPKFDIPLDPRAALQLRKTADDTEVAHGDFVRFRLAIENDDDRDTTDLTIADILPFGFRYLPGSMQRDGVAVADPALGASGVDLSIPLGILASGADSEITYIAEVSPQVRFGMAQSTARATATGGFRSNTAEVMLTVIDALLSRYGTVTGQVIIGECGATGEGVGAQLLLETGQTIRTDSEGLFHIDELSAGPHALRLDEYNLPDGLVPHACPNDLRAGDTATSRTIDVKGGLLRRVTFRLRQLETAAEETVTEIVEEKDAPWTKERLAELPKELSIIYPAEGESMDDPSLAIGIAYPFGKRISLLVNGQPVSNLSAQKTIANRGAGVAMRRWHGIDLPDGASRIEAMITDGKGKEIDRVERIVHYVTEPARATVLSEQSVLMADGQTTPEIAIRVTDDAGRPVHEGNRISITVAPPYQTGASYERFADDPLAERDSTRSVVKVGADGIATVRLRPTSRAGEVKMMMQLGSQEEELRAWLVPAPRPWIMVGIADGTVGYNTISGNMVSADAASLEDDVYTDGRVAFYARGAIRGDWLLTLAYDSAKSRNPSDNDFADQIDPNAYYPVYGDSSTQGQAAASRYPLFVRLERGQFFAMFGDYTTGLNRTQLASYDRRLSGFKSVYEGDRFQVLTFAAEADQQFQRAEFAAVQGIGPYDLNVTDVVRGSETVSLVVRDRERLDTVLSETVLARFVDYVVDYETGEVRLQRAPDPTDAAFNPTFLVVDFETDAADPGTITAGGRVSVTLLDDKVEVGISAVHEEGGAVETSGDLLALDARAQITDEIEIIGEVAASRMDEDGVERDGMAYLAEGIYTGNGWRARAYLHQGDADFGVAQQSVAVTGRRTYGVEVQAQIDDPFADAEDLNPQKYTVTAQASRDEDLDTDARRELVEALISRPVTFGPYAKGQMALGLRASRDRQTSGTVQESQQVVGRASAAILNGLATVTVERNQTIASNGGTAVQDSTLMRVDARIRPTVRATLGVEVLDGDGDSDGGVNLQAGLSAEVWNGGRVDVGMNGIQSDATGSSDTVAATIGVAQDVKLAENVSVSMRVDHTQPLAGADSPVVGSQFSSTTGTSAATNASIGMGYVARGWSASVRMDLRNADAGMSQRIGIGATGDVTDALTLAAAGDITNDDRTTSSGQSGGVTIGAAYRPSNRDMSALYRLRADFDTRNSDRITLVNSFVAEGKVTDRLTVAGAYGIRFRLQDFDGADYDSITQFVGLDTYFSFKQDWSVGLHGDALFSLDGTASYAYGTSLGYSPHPGITLRAGYNFDGFNDPDFSDANVTAQGPYLRLTVRFDENDIRSILPQAGWIDALTGQSQ